jgi:hypothetical protein
VADHVAIMAALPDLTRHGCHAQRTSMHGSQRQATRLTMAGARAQTTMAHRRVLQGNTMRPAAVWLDAAWARRCRPLSARLQQRGDGARPGEHRDGRGREEGEGLTCSR